MQKRIALISINTMAFTDMLTFTCPYPSLSDPKKMCCAEIATYNPIVHHKKNNGKVETFLAFFCHATSEIDDESAQHWVRFPIGTVTLY